MLKCLTACPEGLYKYWRGPAGRDMGDLYDKIKEDVAFRRKWHNGADSGSSCLSCSECTENRPKNGPSESAVAIEATRKSGRGEWI